ncbi:MAG: hypothetical protein CMJ83_01450 [Planctomycetes bacterium]|nr:hypothetical protein [Planctomycetota bacterium]
MRILIALLVVTVILPAQPVEKKQPKRTKLQVPAVSFLVPPTWKDRKPSSSMRKATWRLAGKIPVDVIVYWFGTKGAGSVEANLDRWQKQIQSDQKAKTEKHKIGPGLKATVLDKSGTYVAPLRPGVRERHEKKDQSFFGAIIETLDGPLYVKIVGPTKVVAGARKDVMGWIKSFKYEGSKKPPQEPKKKG